MALKSFVERYAQKHLLTERESQVLYHLVNRVIAPAEIGKLLQISLYTVNNHLKKILEKTRVDSKTELLSDFLLDLNQQINFKAPRPSVLILDDEKELTNTLKEILIDNNIDVYCYNDPLEALDAINKLKIDVIISDIRMPKLNGVSFLSEIRKFHQYEPGFIFISGYPEEYEIESLLDLGAIAFLEKPIDLKKLNRLIWEYIYGSHGELAEEAVKMQLGDVSLQMHNLGFGGFFLGAEQLKGKAILEVGDRIEVSFQIPSYKDKHNAVCEIVWKREKDSGYGVKFLEMPVPAKRELRDYVRTNKILSFIPKNI